MPPRSPRARETADTRERIVEAARHLFWEKGYGATSLSDLLERAGANSGSFYHFFESKDAVLRTVLGTYLDLLDPHVIAPAWKAARSPVDRVFTLLDGYRQRLLDTGCTYGCPIGRLALELEHENAPAHALIAKNFSAWKDAVEGALRAGGVAHADEVAEFVLTVMEGAVMQARAYRSIEPFDASVRQLKLHIRRLTPRRGAARVVKHRRTAKP